MSNFQINLGGRVGETGFANVFETFNLEEVGEFVGN